MYFQISFRYDTFILYIILKSVFRSIYSFKLQSF